VVDRIPATLLTLLGALDDLMKWLDATTPRLRAC
jgi:hypothetical protein